MRHSRRNPLLDLTPLVDILFLLILFFVLTTTFFREGISVALPQGEGEVREETSLSIVLTAEGELFWNRESLTERGTSGARIPGISESRLPRGGSPGALRGGAAYFFPSACRGSGKGATSGGGARIIPCAL